MGFGAFAVGPLNREAPCSEHLGHQMTIVPLNRHGPCSEHIGHHLSILPVNRDGPCSGSPGSDACKNPLKGP